MQAAFSDTGPSSPRRLSDSTHFRARMTGPGTHAGPTCKRQIGPRSLRSRHADHPAVHRSSRPGAGVGPQRRRAGFIAAASGIDRHPAHEPRSGIGGVRDPGFRGPDRAVRSPQDRGNPLPCDPRLPRDGSHRPPGTPRRRHSLSAPGSGGRRSACGTAECADRQRLDHPRLGTDPRPALRPGRLPAGRRRLGGPLFRAHRIDPPVGQRLGLGLGFPAPVASARGRPDQWSHVGGGGGAGGRPAPGDRKRPDRPTDRRNAWRVS